MNELNLDNAPWRVKVYELENEEWQDRGTGYCSGEIMGDEAYLVVVNEDDKRLMILTSRIKGDMQYQKQQETLIVWNEINKNDMALSFQEAEGCSMICDFLIWVQQKYENMITIMKTTPSVNGEAEITEIIAGPISYPPEPKMGNLEQVSVCLQKSIGAQFSHEAIVRFIHEEDYIAKLVKIFYTAEEMRCLDELHNLCRIIKMLLLMNDNAIFETILKDEIIMGVMGILEYDPDFPKLKANHREYLSDESKFNQVIPINVVTVRERIKQTFLLQFLKDVVLARLLDEATFSMLNSLIYFNQIDIIGYLENSEEFTTQLFALYLKPHPIKKRRDGVKFVYQLSNIAKGFPIQQRYPLYIKMARKGIFHLIRFALADEEYATKLIGEELLVTIVEHDPIGSRLRIIGTGEDESVNGADNHNHAQCSKTEEESTRKIAKHAPQNVCEVLISLLKDNDNLELKTQATESIIALLDINNISLIDSNNAHLDSSSPQKSPEEQLHQIAKFEQLFYEAKAPILFADLISMAKQEKINESLFSTLSKRVYIEQLCEVLCHSIQQKRVTSRYFVIKYKLWKAIELLIRVGHKQVRLAAIRCLKCGLESFEQPHITEIIRYRVFGSIFTVLEELGNVNNLIQSSCLEILNIVNEGTCKPVVQWSIKLLLDHLVVEYRHDLESLDYTTVGTSLLDQHETLLDKVDSTSPLGPSSPLTNDIENISNNSLEFSDSDHAAIDNGLELSIVQYDEEGHQENEKNHVSTSMSNKNKKRIGLKRHPSSIDGETPRVKRRVSLDSDEHSHRQETEVNITTVTTETIHQESKNDELDHLAGSGVKEKVPKATSIVPLAQTETIVKDSATVKSKSSINIDDQEGEEKNHKPKVGGESNGSHKLKQTLQSAGRKLSITFKKKD